jgi:hypothetical protein
MSTKYLARCGAALAAAMLTAIGAQAQDTAPVAPAAAPSAEGCEFHVWPGDEMMSVYFGWFHGSTVNGQIQGRRGYPRAPADPIDAATQVSIMNDRQPQQMFGKEGYRLVMHPAPLPSLTIRNTPGRLSDSASPCYAELIVDDVILQQDVITGSFLKTLFHYRDFGAEATPQTRFSTWAQANLDVFPPSRPELMEAAIEEIRGAYRTNIASFAQLAMRPPRPRRR